MALNTYQQITELINRSRNILITTPNQDSGDASAAALALLIVLKQNSQPADVVVSERIKNKLNFINASNQFKTAVSALKKFIISVNISKNKINEFSYDIKDDQLNIFIVPEKGQLNQKDIAVNSGNFKYDLIITINCADMESIGNLYINNTDFFYNTPIINIDNNPANEYFGQINLIDLNSASCAEITYELIKNCYPKSLTEDIATCLLTGTIIKTKNFRQPSITPRSLNLAAELIDLGADKNAINQNLYHKSLPTLNLWGRVLARLKQDLHYKLAWSLISQSDFEKSNTNESHIEGVVEELISNSPQTEIVLILFEKNNHKISGYIYSSPNYNSINLTRPYHPIGTKSRAEFELETEKLIDAEQTIVNYLRQQIKPGH